MATTVKTTKVNEEKQARLWWRIVRGTWRGSRVLLRNIYIDGRVFYGQSKTKIQARYRAWQRERNFKPEEIDFVEIDEVPRGRRRKFRAQYLCFACSRRYKSAYGLNKHFTKAHGSEPLPRDRASRESIVSRDGTEKVWTRLHRPQGQTSTAPKITRSANPMNSTAAQALKSAWARLQESRPNKLSNIRDDMVGIEQAMACAREAIEEYRRHLVQNLGFDPVTVQNLLHAAEIGEDMGKRFTMVIATIEEAYAPDIVAAKKRAGGTRPSDSTLTG